MERRARVTFTDETGTSVLAGVATTLDRVAPASPEDGVVGTIPVAITTYHDEDPIPASPAIETNEANRALITVRRVRSARTYQWVERFSADLSTYSRPRGETRIESASLGDIVTQVLNDALRVRQTKAVLAAREAANPTHWVTAAALLPGDVITGVGKDRWEVVSTAPDPEDPGTIVAQLRFPSGQVKPVAFNDDAEITLRPKTDQPVDPEEAKVFAILVAVRACVGAISPKDLDVIRKAAGLQPEPNPQAVLKAVSDAARSLS